MKPMNHTNDLPLIDLLRISFMFYYMDPLSDSRLLLSRCCFFLLTLISFLLVLTYLGFVIRHVKIPKASQIMCAYFQLNFFYLPWPPA